MTRDSDETGPAFFAFWGQVGATDLRHGLRTETPIDKTFGELADYWIENRAKRKRSCKDDESVIRKHLRPAFGKLVLREIGVEDVDDYLHEREELSPKTLANHLTLLKSMLKLATEFKVPWLLRVPPIKKPTVTVVNPSCRQTSGPSFGSREYRRARISARSPQPRWFLDLGLIHAEHISLHLVQMLDVPRDLIPRQIHLEVQRLMEAREDVVVGDKLPINHGVDVAPIVRVEPCELAHDDVRHAHGLHVEVLQPRTERRELNVDGQLPAERHTAPDDVDVHATPLMDRGLRTGDLDEELGHALGHLVGLQHVAVLGSAVI